ncbi:MAG: hypothetical protein EKK53_12925 [Burkholderiales bacterium]|nr:MAG: hypothetical protein EKK53_12925 [Burkholderiales bacterium]
MGLGRLAGVIGVLVGLAQAASAVTCPPRLRVGFLDVDSPPMLLGQGPDFADPPGWQVVAMRETARRLGCALEAMRLPGLRLDLLLQQGQLEFSLFYGATPERLRWMAVPLDAAGQPDVAWAPLFGHLSLYARADSPAAGGKAWDGTRLAPGVRVGAVAQTTQEQVALSRGWPLETPLSIDNALQMQRAGRFDLLLTARETVRPDMLNGPGRLVELAPPVERRPFFVVASLQLQAAHPAFVAAFWREACLSVRRLAPQARPVECGVAPAALAKP